MVARTERGPLANWLRTVDPWLLSAFGALMAFGVVMALAASPAVAEHIGKDPFHFVNRQTIMLAPSAAMLAAVSFLSPRHTRRAALLLYVASFALIIAALMFGAEVKGARRWILGVQPSEFIKPAFVVLAAWAFTESGRPGVPRGLARALALLLLPLTITPLILEPDFGQTILVSIVWLGLFFMTGLHWLFVVGLFGVGGLGLLLAYKFSPHVHDRIAHFLHPDAAANGVSDTFQIDTALQAILSGGWFGRGPGEGVWKRVLPDAHTDFVYAVAGEEFGIVVCLALIALFGLVVLRALWLASRNRDPFSRAAAAGLAIQFGVQSWINMAVNLRAIPAKGMTLPFISYGGSSEIALAIGMGFLVALTRRHLSVPSVLAPT